MASNIANTVNFGTTGLNVGDYTYSLYALSAPGYLPMLGPYPQYLKSSYPVLGELMNPSPTPVSFTVTSRTLSTAIYPTSLAYGAGKWVVATGSGSNQISSDNGATWSTGSFGSVGISIIAYGNGIFLGSNGGANGLRSTDGVTWTAVTMPVGLSSWYDLVYANNQWLLVGYQASAVSKDNGSTWTFYTQASPYAAQCIAYGDGVWIADYVPGGSYIFRSTNNGVTWSLTEPTVILWSSRRHIAYGNGTFVQVGAEVIGGNYFTTNKVNVSKDGGMTWTAYSNLPATVRWASVTFANGVFVAVAGHTTVNQGAATTAAATSTDGITWTSRTMPASDYWNSVAFGNGTFVAVAGINTSTSSNAATINYAAATTVFSIPAVQTLTGTTAYIKAT